MMRIAREHIDAKGCYRRGAAGGLVALLLALVLGGCTFPFDESPDANNGSFVLVYPARDIAIDGDLGDWPLDIEKHPIQVAVAGTRPDDEFDFRAAFQIAYNVAENALYVGLEVRDDNLVAGAGGVEVRRPQMLLGETSADSLVAGIYLEASADSVAATGLEASADSVAGSIFYHTYDGCEIYLDLGPEVGMAQYVVWGSNSWAFGSGAWEQVEMEMHRADGVHRYEWKVDIAALSGGRAVLKAPMDLGFDVVAIDVDQTGEEPRNNYTADGNPILIPDPSAPPYVHEAIDVVQTRDRSYSFMAWGRGGGKISSRGRVGRALLVEPGTSALDGLALFGYEREEAGRQVPAYLMFFGGILLAFSVVHFLLFAFYPRLRANLYYALFIGTITAFVFLSSQWPLGAESNLSLAQLVILALFLEGVVGLLFFYSRFYQALPGRWWIFLGLLLLDLGVTLHSSFTDAGSAVLGGVAASVVGVSVVAMLGVFGESIRLLIEAIRQKKEGAWIVGIGFGVFIVANMRLVLNILVSIFREDSVSWDDDVTLMLGLLFPLVAMSIDLARSFARTSKDLEMRLRQVEELSDRMQEQNQVLEEANIQIREANRLKSDFLARMSHDLRTPMNAIIGYTRILLRRSKDVLEPRLYRNLENVQLSANNLLTLINDILDLSKIESGHMDIRARPVDLVQVVGECVVAVEPLVAKEVELRRQIAPVAPLHTDPDRVQRMVMNLLGNAVKFTAAGHIEVVLREVEGWAEIAVSDTGSGIPPADLPHIFDEFRQVDGQDGSRHEGTGLGLAIVKKSLALLGGEIEVESEVGKGSRFAIRLRDYAGGGA